VNTKLSKKNSLKKDFTERFLLKRPETGWERACETKIECINSEVGFYCGGGGVVGSARRFLWVGLRRNSIETEFRERGRESSATEGIPLLTNS